jgi:caffeoyl-CoA O-methyltransferase
MKNIRPKTIVLAALLLASMASMAQNQSPAKPANSHEQNQVNDKAMRFLNERKNTWSQGINYWNVSYEDGQLLHDLVVKQKAKSILEVGTSTGHSTIWLAMAAAKTGGKVTTIEIDPERHAEAKRNFNTAGVSHLIDARLADAHELVKTLPGPWDFVFQDADKDWYLNYWNDLNSKMASNGCYTADNVLRPGAPEVSLFVKAAQSDPRFTHRTERGSRGEGLMVICRK